MFGKKAELYLPSGKTSYKTMTGCFCSLLTIGIVVLFGLMLVRDNIIDEIPAYLMQSVVQDFFEPSTEFPAADDKEMQGSFKVAFGIT